MLKVIGLGSELRGDDGIGPHLINELNKQDIPVPLKLIDAGSDAFTILEHLTATEPLLIIDCARMGQTPGTISQFELNEVNLRQVDKAVSLHGFGFAEVYRLAQQLGPVVHCKVIAIEPQTVEFGQSLSEPVEEKVPELVNLVMEEACKYGKEKNFSC